MSAPEHPHGPGHREPDHQQRKHDHREHAGPEFDHQEHGHGDHEQGDQGHGDRGHGGGDHEQGDQGHSGYGHGGHGHRHGISAGADRRWLTVALAAIAAFMAAEVVAGVLADSLALISDAAHMLTDAAAIALALIAMRLAARPAMGSYTYGLKRAEILSAQLNGVSLLLLAAWLTYEAVPRFWSPTEVTGWIVTVTGAVGLAVNVVAAWAISRADRTSLNVRGAYAHVLMDALASVAAIVAGVVVTFTGFDRADPIATLLVVVLMVKAGWGLLRDSTRVLLEAAPAGSDPDGIAHQLLDDRDVVEVHDLHLWLISSAQPALSAHVLVDDDADCHGVRVRLQHRLAERHGVRHATLQVDHAGDHAAEPAAHCAESHGTTHRRGECRAVTPA
ncbi:cation diffusion facilitator family transporter [Catellatospora sp. NPDC049609]|uniref:cation diffusion facilitator family transporter n=1 Tax=Catellatospora sp. NPDC049609 TaxID=3155505 RepID=UPI00343A5D91